MLSMSVSGQETETVTLEQIYHKYIKLMLYTANQILHNKYDSEDAVQQAFLSIAGHLNKLTGIDSPETRAYIVITVERKAIDIIRDKKCSEPLDEGLICGYEFSVPDESPLACAIADLPASYREILSLKYFCGYSTKETAALLGMTYPAARKQLWRAKVMLQDRLREEELL